MHVYGSVQNAANKFLRFIKIFELSPRTTRFFKKKLNKFKNQVGLKSFKHWATEGKVKLVVSDIQSDKFQIAFSHVSCPCARIHLPKLHLRLLYINVMI